MWQQATFLIVSVAVGAAVGVFLRLRYQDKCRNFGVWALSLDWRIYAAEAAAFALLTALQIGYGQHLYAAVMFVLSALAGFTAWKQRAKHTSTF